MQLIALGFLLLILGGTCLLMLPCSSRTGEFTPFITALFTATSATCVTGLILVDTYTHWSFFGQLVLLLLIQIGGLGFITIGTAVSLVLRRKIGLKERGWIKESFNVLDIGGVVRLIKRVLKGTVLFEGIGALLLFTRFYPEMGFFNGLYYSIFHSISAFCNAGFDIMGKYKPYSSFTAYYDDPIVSFTLSALILIGGIGFIVWSDIIDHKWHFKKYALQTKMVLSFSAVLVFGGALLFYVLERNNLYADMSTTGIICSSFFSVITPRTAGFNTADLTAMTPTSKSVMILLMLIGGSPGSTAGGMKTTTFAVLILNMVATFRQKEDIEIFGRRLDSHAIKNAATIVALYIIFFFIGGIAISSIEHLPLLDCLFETASALGTVGLTLGITPTLGIPSQLILILLMFFGRVGGLTLIYAAISVKQNGVKLPLEKITVG